MAAAGTSPESIPNNGKLKVFGAAISTGYSTGYQKAGTTMKIKIMADPGDDKRGRKRVRVETKNHTLTAESCRFTSKWKPEVTVATVTRAYLSLPNLWNRTEHPLEGLLKDKNRSTDRTAQ